jgi:hypothetical protein
LPLSPRFERLGWMTTRHTVPAGIDLYWIPLGAGGSGFVRLNGRIYERVTAGLKHRRPLALYHTALQVEVPEGRFVVETMWPSPDGDTASRGVVVRGPVWSPGLALVRTFRYEVRRWRDGVLPDADEAIGGPQRVSGEVEQARRLLELAASVPALTWGRDELETGEMWNSNSVISWLLVSCGVSMNSVHPPEGGRAPGWESGVSIAQRRPRGEVAAGQLSL